MREYYLLAGNLWRWYQLYGMAPPSKSWVWSFYPDGDVWRKQSELHGRRAIDILTTAYGNATASSYDLMALSEHFKANA